MELWTINDMKRQVQLAVDPKTFDREAILEELHDRYGLVDIETIDHAEFWDIVAKHQLPDTEVL